MLCDCTAKALCLLCDCTAELLCLLFWFGFSSENGQYLWEMKEIPVLKVGSF